MNLKKLLLSYFGRLLLFSAIVASATITLAAQQIKLSFKQTPIKTILKEVTAQTGYNFVYSDALKELDAKKDFTYQANNTPITKLLEQLLDKSGVEFIIKNKQIVLTAKKAAQAKGAAALVKGKVSQTDGEPLVGVTVINERTKEGVFSELDGTFSIKAAAGDKITFTCIGMLNESVDVLSTEKDLSIKLLPDNILLDDIVIIGYGSKDKKSITSSIGSVKKSDIETLAATSVTMDNMLSGTVKGVLTVQSSGEPGAAPRINVRGITSPYPNLSGQSGNVPLYVIDGVPMFMDNNALNPLMSIAPADIESIDVLKDASATAIYGSRGANGVVIVKTKCGKRGEDLHVDFNYSIAVSNPVKQHKPLNLSEYKQHQDMLIGSAVEVGNQMRSSAPMYFMQSMMDPNFPNIFKMGNVSLNMETYQLVYDGLNNDAFGTNDTNWNDEIANKNALTHNYNLGLSGSTDKLTYNASLTGLNQEGLYINDKMNHYGARVTLDAQISKAIKAGVVLNNAYSNRKSGSSGASTIDTWLFRPDMPVYAQDGTFARADFSSMYLSKAEGANPVARMQGKNEFKANQITGNAYVVADLLKGLSARVDFSVANYKYENSYFTPLSAMDITTQSANKSTLSQSNSNNYNTSLNFRLDYILNVNKHLFTAMLGYGSDRSSYKNKNVSYEGFPNDEYLNNPGSAQKVRSYSDYISKGGLNSVYARLSYGYDNRYLAELSLRADESSKFGPDNRWGFFPALSLGWVMSNEDFLKDSKVVDNLKLRLSAGRTGSTNVADFSYKQYLLKDSEGAYEDYMAVTLKDLLPNEGIKWEMTTEYNGGLDFSFFDGRLYGSLDAYYRFTKGALAPAPHNLESGFTTYYSNLLDMSNRGLEIELGGDIIRSKSFKWNSNINIALNRNRIEKLNGASISSLMQDAYIEGMPAGTLKGYVVEKIFQSQEEIDALNKAAQEKGFDVYQYDCGLGDYMFKDINGDGTIDTKDREVIANPQPKFFGGWTNTLSYKNFQLSFLLQFSVGGEALYNSLITDATAQLSAGLTREMWGNTWTPTNTDAKYARLVPYAYNNMNWSKNDRFVFKTSYLRLKNITLSYNLPNSWMNKCRIQGASVFVTGSNLFTISEWPGIDPELLGSAVTQMATGSDSYPLSKSFTFGVRFRF